MESRLYFYSYSCCYQQNGQSNRKGSPWHPIMPLIAGANEVKNFLVATPNTARCCYFLASDESDAAAGAEAEAEVDEEPSACN